MSRTCTICGKGTITGNNVPRKGLAKKKGGVGQHIGVKTRRVFKPNLTKIKTFFEGKTQTIRICMRCMRSNKVVKKV